MLDALDDVTFPAAFGLAPGSLPSGTQEDVVYYPGASRTWGHDGMILRVVPADGSGITPWTAVFARGLLGGVPDETRRRVVTLPGGVRFLVLCEGAGYVVNANDQNDWSEVSAIPVRSVVVAPDHDLVVVGNFTNLLAYGTHGIAWESERLVWDWLAIVGIEGDRLLARGFDAPADNDAAEFHVDLATGRSDDKPYLDEY